jgi:hypothetical protein
MQLYMLTSLLANYKCIVRFHREAAMDFLFKLCFKSALIDGLL